MDHKSSLPGNTERRWQSVFWKNLQQIPGKKRPKAGLIDTALHGKGAISYLMMSN